MEGTRQAQLGAGRRIDPKIKFCEVVLNVVHTQHLCCEAWVLASKRDL
jgi:hypothetical protein